MTKREKILAAGVGFTLLILGLQWGFSKYQGAVKQRETRQATLNDQILTSEAKQLEGALAQRRMGEYSLRSLPSDLETAQGRYSQFLSNLISEVGLERVSAKPSTSTGIRDLYTQLNFNVTGTGTLEQMLELLHQFHSTDFLHRISSLSMRKTPNGVTLDMTVQALAMATALPDAPSPAEQSPLIAADFDEYRLPIMNRNPLSPPNRRPVFAADKSIEATLGERLSYAVRFEDPDEGQQLSYTLVGDVPSGVEIDERSGRLSFRPEDLGNVELQVQASDNGWPRQTSEERLVIKVVEPEVEEVEPERPKFDEASQTFLTGLTQSRGQWMAMLHLRTQGKTLKLRVGDSFEVGTMRGEVVEVTERFAVLEREGERFVLSFDASLADAWSNAAP